MIKPTILLLALICPNYSLFLLSLEVEVQFLMELNGIGLNGMEFNRI